MRGMKEMESEPLVEAAAEICRWHHERVDGQRLSRRAEGQRDTDDRAGGGPGGRL